MADFPAASRRCRQTAIAFLLCFLAISCAIEAKLAWYDSAPGPCIGVSSTKAIPSDMRDFDSDSASTPDQMPSQFAYVLLPIFAVVWFVATDFVPKRHNAEPPPRTYPAWYFPPQISFRPPPAL